MVHRLFCIPTRTTSIHVCTPPAGTISTSLLSQADARSSYQPVVGSGATTATLFTRPSSTHSPK